MRTSLPGPRALGVGLVLALAAAGCDSTEPAGPDRDELTEVEARALFQEVAEEQGVRLPSLPRLLHQVRLTIREGGGHPEGVELLQRAHDLRREARDAFAAGDREEARRLADAARLTLLEAVVSVLGEEAATDAVSSVENALASLRQRLGDRTPPPPLLRRLQRLASLVGDARDALDAGDTAGALDAALQAASGFRRLAPEAAATRAEAALGAAQDRLQEARAAAGSDPEERVETALRRAGALLDRATAAFEAERHLLAVDLARRSHRLSTRILHHLASGGG